MDRFTLCIEEGLLDKLDGIVAERGYPSRSQAMADFIRRAITKKNFKNGQPCVADISVIYHTGKKSPIQELQSSLEKNSRLIAAQHTVFLGNSQALLSITAVGQPDSLQQLADLLRAIKGVKHGSFSIVASI